VDRLRHFLVYRATSGIAKYYTLTLVGGVAAIAIGLIMLTMNAIERLPLGEGWSLWLSCWQQLPH
jgi:hypothetical protein